MHLCSFGRDIIQFLIDWFPIDQIPTARFPGCTRNLTTGKNAGQGMGLKAGVVWRVDLDELCVCERDLVSRKVLKTAVECL